MLRLFLPMGGMRFWVMGMGVDIFYFLVILGMEWLEKGLRHDFVAL